MDIQQILSQRIDDLRAELAAIRHRLDTLDRRTERPFYPPGTETEWWWWLPFLAIAAGIPVWIFAAVMLHLVRLC